MLVAAVGAAMTRRGIVPCSADSLRTARRTGDAWRDPEVTFYGSDEIGARAPGGHVVVFAQPAD